MSRKQRKFCPWCKKPRNSIPKLSCREVMEDVALERVVPASSARGAADVRTRWILGQVMMKDDEEAKRKEEI